MVDGGLAVAPQECAGLRETTLPIESRVVNSCKGRIPDCGGGVSLSLIFGMGRPQSLW